MTQLSEVCLWAVAHLVVGLTLEFFWKTNLPTKVVFLLEFAFFCPDYFLNLIIGSTFKSPSSSFCLYLSLQADSCPENPAASQLWPRVTARVQPWPPPAAHTPPALDLRAAEIWPALMLRNSMCACTKGFYEAINQNFIWNENTKFDLLLSVLV